MKYVEFVRLRKKEKIRIKYVLDRQLFLLHTFHQKFTHLYQVPSLKMRGCVSLLLLCAVVT
jgi:hypothetical protein